MFWRVVEIGGRVSRVLRSKAVLDGGRRDCLRDLIARHDDRPIRICDRLMARYSLCFWGPFGRVMLRSIFGCLLRLLVEKLISMQQTLGGYIASSG